jgi:hypothetical protein
VGLTRPFSSLLEEMAPGMDRAVLTDYLTELDQHLLATEHRILRQRERIETSERRGYPSTAAKDLLRAFEQTRDRYLSERARLRALLDN